jgi:hypothetical protein
VKEKIKMVHMLDTDEGIICLEEVLRELSENDREAIISLIVQLDTRIKELSPPEPFDGTCPGCGRKDC